MNTVTLYQYKGDDIRISVVAYFKEGSLMVEGNDTGTKVAALTGSPDYEYNLTVPAAAIGQLSGALGVHNTDELEILQQLAAAFQKGTCFSDLKKFLTEKQIPHQVFIWP